MLPTRFQFVWPSGFKGEDFFYKSTNQKYELPVAAILSVTNTKELYNLGKYIFKAAFHFREYFKISKLHFRESRVTVIGRLYRETDTVLKKLLILIKYW